MTVDLQGAKESQLTSGTWYEYSGTGTNIDTAVPGIEKLTLSTEGGRLATAACGDSRHTKTTAQVER